MGRGRYLANFLTIRPGVVKGCRVLELGAGAGLPGLVAARCGAAEVLLTDGDARAVRLLEKNIAANPSSECPVEAAVLAYGAAPPPPSDPKLATVILAADALYVSRHCAPFGDTLTRRCARRGTSATSRTSRGAPGRRVLMAPSRTRRTMY